MRQQETDPYRIGYQRNTIHWHAYHGKYTLVARWLAAGGNINKRDRRGQTPVHAATHGRQLRIVRYLIAHDADVNLFSDEQPYHTYPIQAAVYNGDLEIVKALIAAGADISVRAGMGCSLLHIAALEDHAEIADLLLNLGISVDILNDYGQTPLRDAAMHNNFPISSVLLQAGADANANTNDIDGFNPLFQVNSIELIKSLVAHGADVNHRSNEGQTPIFYAYSPEAIEALISAGAIVDLVDCQGESPLHFAAHNFVRPAAIEKLLTFFPDVNSRDHAGHTPLWHALDCRDDDIANLLRRHGGTM